jgi:hypothetical protein
MVARFRSEYARHAGEPAYERFIAELGERSPRFVQWWGEHEVTDVQRGTKTLEHATLGTLRLHHAQTVPTGAPDLRLTVYASRTSGHGLGSNEATWVLPRHHEPYGHASLGMWRRHRWFGAIGFPI